MQSVGGSSPPEASVKICAICGRISSARNFCEFREFRGRTYANKLGMGSVEGIRRAAWVWHPCHTHAATKLSSHRIHGTHRNNWRRRKNLCTSVQSVGGSSPPVVSVYSVKSVGEYPPPEISVNSVNSVGGLAQTNLEWVLWKEFGGRRGYGRDAIPSYENSHGLHRCAQIRRQNAT